MSLSSMSKITLLNYNIISSTETSPPPHPLHGESQSPLSGSLQYEQIVLPCNRIPDHKSATRLLLRVLLASGLRLPRLILAIILISSSSQPRRLTPYLSTDRSWSPEAAVKKTSKTSSPGGVLHTRCNPQFFWPQKVLFTHAPHNIDPS